MKARKITRVKADTRKVKATNEPIVIDSSAIKKRQIRSSGCGGCCGKGTWRPQ